MAAVGIVAEKIGPTKEEWARVVKFDDETCLLKKTCPETDIEEEYIKKRREQLDLEHPTDDLIIQQQESLKLQQQDEKLDKEKLIVIGVQQKKK